MTETSGCCAPAYDPVSMNSNTWADALIEKYGLANEFDMIHQLETRSHLDAIGYQNGYQIESVF